MLSGIGPADHLRDMDIDPVVDAPGVGANLQDHFSVAAGYASLEEDSFDDLLRLDRLTLDFFKWALFARGHLTSLPVSALAHIRTKEGLAQPDIELLLGRIAPEAHMWFPGWRKPNGAYLGCRVILLHPESRGRVSLRSGDAADKPMIFHDYFAHEMDLVTLREGVRAARRVYGTEPLADMIGDEIYPGTEIQTDEEIDAYIRQTASTIYPPVGTCRMGMDEGAVVDGQLRVRGVEGLRVADASVIPTVLGGHTNAPTIAIAEKAADMILGKAAPPAMEV